MEGRKAHASIMYRPVTSKASLISWHDRIFSQDSGDSAGKLVDQMGLLQHLSNSMTLAPWHQHHFHQIHPNPKVAALNSDSGAVRHPTSKDSLLAPNYVLSPHLQSAGQKPTLP